MADFQIFRISFLGGVLEEHYEVKQEAEKNFSEKESRFSAGSQGWKNTTTNSYFTFRDSIIADAW